MDADTPYARAFADDYDQLYEGRDDVALVCDVLAELAGAGTALEFGVGTGRIALPLADRGVTVTGIDDSRTMLDLLRAKPGADRLRLVQGDCTTVEAPGAFDLVFMVFSTLFLLPTQDVQVAAFANAARHLRPGGAFLLETFVHDRRRWANDQEVAVTDVGEGSVGIRVGRLDPAAQRIDTQHVVIAPDGIRLRPNALRFAYPAEMDLMARLAGLRLRERWADWTRAPFTGGSPNQVVVYERPAR